MKILIRRAIDECKIRYVDVNEQNPNALTFYKKNGISSF